MRASFEPRADYFARGGCFRLVVWGKDACRYPRLLIQALHDDSVNRGRHVIDSGSGYNSHLLVPVVPAGGRRVAA